MFALLHCNRSIEAMHTMCVYVLCVLCGVCVHVCVHTNAYIAEMNEISQMKLGPNIAHVIISSHHITFIFHRRHRCWATAM